MIQTSGQISTADVREEGAKISWRSPNYPTIPNSEQFNTCYGWAQNRDVNHQLGRDLNDDSVDWQQFFGWDTWRKPIIEWVKMHQYHDDYGVRLAWKLTGRDGIRSGYAIFRSQTKSDVVNGVDSALIAYVRYASEYNPSSGIMTQYCDLDIVSGGGAEQDKRVKGVKISYDWDSLSAHGDYDNTDPDGNAVYDPTVGDNPPQLIVSLVDTGPAGTDAGATYYYAVQPIDGRQFHELGEAPSDGTFTINNPTTLSDYNKGNLLLASVDALGDSASGDGGIVVFSAYNGLTADQDIYEAFIEPTNLYYPYLSGSSGDIWYAYDSDTSKIQPDSWTKGSGLPLHLTNLSSNTSYKVWLAPYREGDGNSPTADYETVTFFTDKAVPNAPEQLVFTGKNHPDYDLDWCHTNENGIDPTGYRVWYRNKTDDTAWENFDTGSTATNATVTVNDLQNSGDEWEFYVVALGPDGESPPSNTINSQLDPVTSGANC